MERRLTLGRSTRPIWGRAGSGMIGQSAYWSVPPGPRSKDKARTMMSFCAIGSESICEAPREYQRDQASRTLHRSRQGLRVTATYLTRVLPCATRQVHDDHKEGWSRTNKARVAEELRATFATALFLLGNPCTWPRPGAGLKQRRRQDGRDERTRRTGIDEETSPLARGCLTGHGVTRNGGDAEMGGGRWERSRGRKQTP